MKAGDRFEVVPPGSTNWDIHHNTLSGCVNPVTLNSYGSATAVFRDNTITREGASGVKQAVVVRGRFSLLGNLFAGFDEPGSTALGLGPDRLGNPLANLYRGNTFRKCAAIIADTDKQWWSAAKSEGNTYLDCGTTP